MRRLLRESWDGSRARERTWKLHAGPGAGGGPQRPPRYWSWGGAGMALRAYHPSEGQFVARGGAVPREAKLDAEVMVVQDGKSVPVEGATLRASDRLVVRTANLSSEPAYFMALALDAQGAVHCR